MTLHSWGAIAPSVDSVDKLISYIKTARPALLRWRKTQILIIDEGTPLRHASREEPYSVFCLLITVSMVDGHLFEKICEIAARLRKKTDRPFGGLQVGSVNFREYLQMTMMPRSSSSLAISSSCPRSLKMANNLSLLSSVMHGKHASSTLSH